jgi:protein-tyrosine-phosphatase
MNILFVCRANVGRSQVAQVCFNKLSRHTADSAGIAVDELIAKQHLRGRTLKDVTSISRAAEYNLECIRHAFGVDIADKERQQLTPQMVDAADLVVVIAEKEQWPAYLKEGVKVVCWDIPDAVGQEDAFVYEVFTQVRRRVEQLVAEIG